MEVVEVVTDAASAEVAADALWQAGASAVSEVALDGGRVRLTADVLDPAAVDPHWRARLIEVDSDAYLDAWRGWARPERAGRRIVVWPAWLPVAAEPGEVTVLVDPGRTFGSGSHPSTRLALALIEEHLRSRDRLLDVGCGSGVLAVTACLLGSASARAIDVDPTAVLVTNDNAATNGVADRVMASTEPVDALDTDHDVVVANISARALVDLAPHLLVRTARGGSLLLAGFLADQIDDVRAAVPDASEVGRHHLDGWAALALRRE